MAKRRKSSNKTLYMLLGALALIIVLVIIAKSAGLIGQKKAIEVELAEVSQKTIVERVSASGMIQPVTEITLSPDVAGEIIQLNVQEGQSVRAGDFLVKIRPDNWINARERAEASLNQQIANLASARAALSTAEANITRAEAEYKRQQQLWEDKVISEAEWQQAQQAYSAAKNDLKSAEQQVIASQYIVKSSEASLQEAQENVQLTNVIAPMSGTISKLSVEQGERVVGTQQMAGTEMLRIADLDSMEVRVDVNENDIIRVALGDTAIIDVDAYSHLDREFKGVVTAIANSANDKTSPDAVTEFEVRITILKSSYADLKTESHKFPFRPGMTASVEIMTERLENVVAVPLSSVTTRNPNKKDFKNTDEEGQAESEDGDDSEEPIQQADNEDEMVEVVFVVKEGIAELRKVKTGISDFEFIQILEGVELGEEIVSGPFLVVSKRLENGDLVEVAEEDQEEREE